jgi:hypothetical protein
VSARGQVPRVGTVTIRTLVEIQSEARASAGIGFVTVGLF